MCLCYFLQLSTTSDTLPSNSVGLSPNLCRLQDYTLSPASPDPVSPVSLKPKRAALSQEALAAKELQRERRRRERAYRRMQVRRWCSHEPVSAIV
jgi:hypothetical protein